MSDLPAVTAGFEEVMADLEKTIGRLAAGTAPLDELVSAHERAVLLLAAAQSRLAELEVQATHMTELLE
ncbi:MAG TPA: exodeoxyribonuclease VII small subunit [Patescibacteria group bacterium]|nr:exodeoxyribonuclease VII small subunit [Patescibacteria group bacterium]